MTDPAATATPADVDAHPLDADLLDLIQTEFPLVAEPYATFAEKLGVEHALVIERIQALRDNGKIRQISAIFDTRRLGYVSSLVAARIEGDQARVDQAADIFSAHPGVSHNYLREHDFNIWFTVAVPPDSKIGLDGTIDVLGQLAGVDAIRALPNERFFKIGVDLDVKGGRAANAKQVRRDPEADQPKAPEVITEDDKRAIRALQTDLPATERPFAVLGEQFGFSEQELIDRGQAFLASRQMRRFAAVLAHRKAGFVFNGMGVWKVPAERVEECGLLMGAYRGVSHCYQRPTYPDWPYNLFSMTHGRTKAECEDVLTAISKETGLDDYIVLYSTKEYKKTRVSYFTPETYAWEHVHEAFLSPA